MSVTTVTLSLWMGIVMFFGLLVGLDLPFEAAAPLASTASVLPMAIWSAVDDALREHRKKEKENA